MEVDQEETPSALSLLNMNDDCIEAIFERLPVSELGSFSFTCKRLYALACEFFNRHHTDESIIIEKRLGWNGIRFAYGNNNYKRYFASYFRRVNIYSDTISTSNGMLTFFTKNCCENLIELGLNHIRYDGSQSISIKNHLQQIETLVIRNCDIPNLYADILIHCKKLKNLTIKQGNDWNTFGDNVRGRIGNDWSEHTYPSLKFFSYFEIEDECADLEQFFIQNTSIERVECSNLKTINTICCHGIRLKHFSLQIERETERTFWNDVEAYLIFKLVDCFELNLDQSDLQDEDISRIKALGKYTAFHGFSLLTIGRTADICAVAEDLKNLKYLCTQEIVQFINAQTLIQYKCLAESLPLIEELYVRLIDANSPNNDDLVIKMIMPFVSSSKYLRFIVLDGPNNLRYMHLLRDVVEARSKLQNAVPLTVYLNDDLCKRFQPTIPVSNFVSFKPLPRNKSRRLTGQVKLSSFYY